MPLTDRVFGKEQMQQAKEVYDYAVQQLEEGKKQEHFNDIEYSDAQLQLEQAIQKLEQVERLANLENRDEFNRLRRQLIQLQHQMIITPH